jgi:hypothetical protein
MTVIRNYREKSCERRASFLYLFKLLNTPHMANLSYTVICFLLTFPYEEEERGFMLHLSVCQSTTYHENRTLDSDDIAYVVCVE